MFQRYEFKLQKDIDQFVLHFHIPYIFSLGYIARLFVMLNNQ